VRADAVTLLLVARREGERVALRAALEDAGFRVIPLGDERDAEQVLRAIAVDALVVQGEPELVQRVARAAGATPWIAIDGPRGVGAAVLALLAPGRGGDRERLYN
jgi:hypothetical protein